MRSGLRSGRLSFLRRRTTATSRLGRGGGQVCGVGPRKAELVKLALFRRLQLRGVRGSPRYRGSRGEAVVGLRPGVAPRRDGDAVSRWSSLGALNFGGAPADL